ncbi:hypothetical protein ABT026_08490 [Streptomyces sp. NPDC002734]|uniref:hypothetical protein n=1 Tax=Streptomyces sp. NPDC002734 TaxID=3154426 RepID=UPI00331EA12B
MALIEVPGDSAERLAALGMKWEYCERAIRAGEAARREATPTEPPTAPGLRDWIARVGMLRYTMIIEEGWTPLNHKNMALVVNPDQTVAIGVLAGDAGTGWPAPHKPRSRYPKGQAFANAVAGGDLTLFSTADAGHPEVLEPERIEALDLWLLLTNRVRQGENVTVYSELSRPESVSSTGYIVDWLDRMILPRLTFEAVLVDDGRNEDGGFDVLVEEI